MLSLLRKLENAVENAFSRTPAAGDDRVEPLDLVRQIERAIESNKRVFINGQVFVAHKLVIHLYAPSRSRIEEYEALFNDAQFREYLEQYINERGYILKAPIRIVIQCHSDLLPEFSNRHCWVEFAWPQTSSEPGEVTVVLDALDPARIVAFNEPLSSEVPAPAWLEVLSGRAHRDRLAVNRREFFLGRGENVLDSQRLKVVRVNHLAFKPREAGDPVNASVSRLHARIVWRNGTFLLDDTGSENGTRIERGRGVLICPPPSPRQEGLELQDGDVIVLGHARLAFHLGPL